MTNITRLYRRYLNNKTTYVLNIATLVLGLVSFIYIFNYVYIHQNFDNFHPNADRLYKINTKIYKDGAQAHHWPSTSMRMGPEFKARFPEIENYTRYSQIIEGIVVSNNEQSLRVERNVYADSNFFKVFSPQVIEGDLNQALINPNSIVITESIQQVFFGNEDPIGKSLTLHSDKHEPREVFITAVIHDMPDNSELTFDIAGTLPLFIDIFGSWVDTWPMHASFTFLQLKSGTDVAQLEAKFDEVVAEKMGDFARNMGREYEYYLTNIRELHYANDFSMFNSSSAVSRSSLIIMLNIGIIILVISLINNLNFQISQVHAQLKNLGIQKIIGSNKRRLFLQFLGESFSLNILSLLITLGVLYVLSPSLNRMFHINFEVVAINSAKLWLIITGVFIGSSLLVASYPASIITRVNPLHIMQRKLAVFNAKSGLKRALVSFQFGASIFLIIATLLVQKQKQHMLNHTQGFNPENILAVPSPMTSSNESFKQYFSTFKGECLKIPGVNRVSYTSCVPGTRPVKMPYENPSKIETRDSYHIIESDFSYLDILKTEFLAGRNFRNNESDRNSIILNETACLAMGFADAQSAIGSTIRGDNMNRTIIGVIQDYHHMSPKYSMAPYLYLISDFRTQHFVIDLNGKLAAGTLDKLRGLYAQFFPENPFDYTFLNEKYADQYQSENQLGKLFIVFSIIAIAISCLGLIGLSLIESKLRIKEIGVRKVNGARLIEILSALNKDYMKWVSVAFLITVPLAWYAMNSWLQNFAIRTNISWWIFVLAGCLAMLVAVVTVSWQSWKAASRNPVESLRYE